MFSSSNLINYILIKLLFIPGAILAFSLKGFGQAFVSDKLGDPTPRNNDKLTLNPFSHIDIIGFIFIVLFGFGWGKPVPTNSKFYKNYKQGRALVSLSGPAFLILGGFIMSFVFGFVASFTNISESTNVLAIIAWIFYYAMSIMLSLANFYLLPLPGLDGYNFITTFTPASFNNKLYNIERYSLFIFIGFILLIDYTSLSSIIFYPATLLSNVFLNLSTLFWGLIF